MQLFGIDNEGNLTEAESAFRGIDYLCPECQTSLRVRRGKTRLPHFYHLSLRSCRLGAKSIEHLQAQLFFKEHLSGEVTLEHAFPQINRIADVLWHDKRIVFEVQCSPISLSEVKSRVFDYNKIYYEVIFILHDKNFNKLRISPAEKYLRHQTSFYTNMNHLQEGIFYDQLERFSAFRRTYKSAPLPVIFSSPKILPRVPTLPYSGILLARWKASKWLFEGDLFDRKLNLPEKIPLRDLKNLKYYYTKVLDRVIKRIF